LLLCAFPRASAALLRERSSLKQRVRDFYRFQLKCVVAEVHTLYIDLYKMFLDQAVVWDVACLIVVIGEDTKTIFKQFSQLVD